MVKKVPKLQKCAFCGRYIYPHQVYGRLRYIGLVCRKCRGKAHEVEKKPKV